MIWQRKKRLRPCRAENAGNDIQCLPARSVKQEFLGEPLAIPQRPVRMALHQV